MKKITQKITKYGALSMALAGVADASGQIVFTDINPDSANGLEDSFSIDFNEDGIIDMTIFQERAIYYEQVVLEGQPVGFITDVQGFLYASNLSEGDLVGPDSDFTTGTDTGEITQLCYNTGYNNAFCIADGDELLGARFQVDGENHYGWVQLSIVTSDSFTVESFAYEATPDTAIEAGTDATALSLEDNTIEGFTSFVSNNALTLSAKSPLQDVTIHNLNGQTILSRTLNNTSETIDINTLSTGVYIATVQVEGRSTAIKFVR